MGPPAVWLSFMCRPVCVRIVVFIGGSCPVQLSLVGEEGLVALLLTGLKRVSCPSLFVYSSSWCLRRASVCDCGTPWTFLLPFLV